jgi:HAD superfamily hydrolase (TIGR01509 family)
MIGAKSPTVMILAPTSTRASQPRVFTSIHTNKHRNVASTLQKSQKAATLRAIAPRSGVVVAALRNFDWPEALLFDCDGVLVDTEAEGHRVAFNEAFKRKGLPHEWGLEQYGELLEVGGGKERMNAYFTQNETTEPWLSMKDPDVRKDFLKELHELKTDIFNELIETGKLPVRPGVSRLINEAIDNGVKVAVCSTSNERAVSNIVRVMLGEKIASHMRVFAGDMVPKKKPAPDIYLMAAKEYDVDPARCVVVEDSRIGLAAGKAAGMRVVVTESYYTKGEDFSIADAVFDCIGEKGDERFSLHDLTTPGKLE